MLEKHIQQHILMMLKLHGIFTWQNYSTGVFDPVKKIFRPSKGLKGVSDILGILPSGQFLAIEIKSAKGKPSETQSDFIRNIKNNNGVAFVAKSWNDVAKELGLDA